MPSEPPVEETFEVHFVESCRCAECRVWRKAQHSEQRWKQIYWHGRKLADVCCGECPDCWHHY